MKPITLTGRWISFMQRNFLTNLPNNAAGAMNKVRSLLLISFLGFGLPGCAYVDTKTPGDVHALTDYQLTSKDFRVLDRVSATGETTTWFGMVMTGGKGYQDLLEQAQKLGGDDIMNYSFDMEQRSVFLFIYSKYQWKATGLAVKYAEHVYKK